MRLRIELACLAFLLVVPTAYADILPTPDRGPPSGSAGGLNFAVQWVEFEMGPINGPRYSKSAQVVVLVGCVDGQPNCQLARAKNLIGMEVSTVDGKDLQPEKGMVRQIVDAFKRQAAAPTVTLELYSRPTNKGPIKVDFARH